MIDELFKYKFGELPYRSLDFKFENVYKEYFQEAAVISYPNTNDYTRITEYKQLTGQRTEFTTIGKEFPINFERENTIPYYPIPDKKNRDKYLRNVL